jgi:hypothetical protein
MSTKQNEHLIDCDDQPYIPWNWSLEDHQRNGQFSFDPSRIELYVSKKQEKSWIVGYDLWEELMRKKS